MFVIFKGNANERKGSSLPVSRVQLALCKGSLKCLNDKKNADFSAQTACPRPTTALHISPLRAVRGSPTDEGKRLFRTFFAKSWRKVWWYGKNSLPLHRNSGTARLQRLGSVAQLNRASDYGSEGYGFESHRSHKVNERRIARCASFVFSRRTAQRRGRGAATMAWRHGHHDWHTGKPTNVLRQLKRMPPRGNTSRFAFKYRPFQAAKRAVSHSKTARFGKRNGQCQQTTGTQTVTKMPQDAFPFTMVNT